MKKKLLLLSLIILSAINVFPQSAEGRYNSFRTRDGMLFFIVPEKLKEVSGIKKFEYDVTLLNWTDSVTVNFTFESNAITVPTDVSIFANDKDIKSSEYSPLFVDAKKNHYEIRMTSKYTFKEFESIVNSNEPPRFCFTQGDERKYATYSIKNWRKDSKKLKDILQIFKLSL